MSFKKYSKKARKACKIEAITKKQLTDRASNIRSRDRNAKYRLQEIGRRGGCEFCGMVDHPLVYQWHHIDDEDPRKKKISTLVQRGSLERLIEEFNKVVMLCPTCHWKFHQDLCCMFEHKDQHIKGTFLSIDTEEEEEEEPQISFLSVLIEEN